MKGNKKIFAIKLMAKILELSKTEHYAWSNRKTSNRAKRHAEIKLLINEAHDRSRQTYEPLRLKDGLPVKVGRDQISKL